MQILVLLRRSASIGYSPMPREIPVWGNHDLVQACRKYIRANLAEALSLSSLAELFCVSSGHLARTFRRELGLTVHEYLLAERIAEAKRLMATQEDMTITEIAMNVGFQSLSHFSRTFRQHVGQSPVAYRKQLDHV